MENCIENLCRKNFSDFNLHNQTEVINSWRLASHHVLSSSAKRGHTERRQVSSRSSSARLDSRLYLIKNTVFPQEGGGANLLYFAQREALTLLANLLGSLANLLALLANLLALLVNILAPLANLLAPLANLLAILDNILALLANLIALLANLLAPLANLLL